MRLNIILTIFLINLTAISCSNGEDNLSIEYPPMLSRKLEQNIGSNEKTEPINNQDQNNKILTPSIENTTKNSDIDDNTECTQFYSEDSIWNVPIDWSEAQIHPDSDAMMAAFFESNQWIGTNTDSYAPNIYFITSETPLVSVQLREYSFRDAINDQEIIYGEPGGVVWMPLPKEARPAAGTDGQLAIINLDTGEEWGLIKGQISLNGQWYADGAYRYHINNSGIPPKGFGQRGAGISQIAGIVRPCEVDRGLLGHAVTLAYDFPCTPETCEARNWPAVIPPFTKTDGRGNNALDIPQGTRMVIRPEITTEEIAEACHRFIGCISWVENMQLFGGFIVDNSGHPKTYGEGNITANWDPDIWTNKILKDIPMDWYAILDWNSDTAARDQ